MNNESLYPTIYHQGELAFLEGKKLENNPYEKESIEFKYWEHGYNTGAKSFREKLAGFSVTMV